MDGGKMRKSIKEAVEFGLFKKIQSQFWVKTLRNKRIYRKRAFLINRTLLTVRMA